MKASKAYRLAAAAIEAGGVDVTVNDGRYAILRSPNCNFDGRDLHSEMCDVFPHGSPHEEEREPGNGATALSFMAAIASKGERDADTLHEAAALIASGKQKDPAHGSCSAIAEAMYPKMNRFDGWQKAKRHDLVSSYTEAFKPHDGAHAGGYWGESWGDTDAGGYWGESWGNTDAKIEQCRILALCFAAAMAETGDL